MRALLAQLRDFEIASCLIKADRTHNDGKPPMSAQAKGEPAAIVPATIQMPKAMIPIEIKNENATFMLASISKEERSA